MQKALLDAIYVRNQCRSGIRPRKWIVEQIERLADEKNWSPAQIAAIVGYAPQTVRKRLGARESRVEGGKLSPAALDIMLSLMGTVSSDQQANLLEAVIATGTSTRLIARVTGIPLGTVLYRQRVMKKENPDDAHTEREHDAVPHL